MTPGFGALQHCPKSWLCHRVSHELPQRCWVRHQPGTQRVTVVSTMLTLMGLQVSRGPRNQPPGWAQGRPGVFMGAQADGAAAPWGRCSSGHKREGTAQLGGGILSLPSPDTCFQPTVQLPG